jgi:uncharacterized membrane protein
MFYCKHCGAQLTDGAAVCPSCGRPVADENAYDAADIQANKGMAVLAYLGILVLVPLLAAPKSRFARYHANQGLVLCIAEIAISIVVSILSAIVPFFGILGLANVALLVLAIMGIINAAKGLAVPLPLIGTITILK